MIKKEPEFGLTAIFKGYTIKDFFCDARYPIVLATILIGISFISNVDSFSILQMTTDLTLSIIPAILGLVVAGYTILISFYWSETATKIKEKDGGSNLLKSMNGDFAFVILLIILSLLYSIVIKFIITLKISFEYDNVINYIALLLQLFLLFFSLKILKDVVTDTYNIGISSLK